MLETMFDPGSEGRFAADNKLFVVFSMHAVQSGAKTEKEGRPIFDEIPHIKIIIPGDKNTVIERPVTDEDKQRFAPQWEKFQSNLSQSPVGTPLEQWPLMTVGIVQELKALNIATVEQLAGMSDAAAMKFMGGYEYRRKAEAFLSVSKNTAEAQRLVTLNDELTARLTAQDAFIRQMAARLEALEAREKVA